jgi:hypothetical protein
MIFAVGPSIPGVLVLPVAQCVGHADIAPSRLSGGSVTCGDGAIVPRVFHGLPLIGDPEIDRLQTEG